MAVDWVEINPSPPEIPGVGRRDTPSADAADALGARLQFLFTAANWISVNRALRVSLEEMRPRVDRVLHGRRDCGIMIYVTFQSIHNEWITHYMYVSHTEDMRIFRTPAEAMQWRRANPTVSSLQPLPPNPSPGQADTIVRCFWFLTSGR